MKKILATLGLACFPFLSMHCQAFNTFEMQAKSEASQPLIESEIFNLINQHRVSYLLKPFSWSSTPAHVARQHSLDMASGLSPFGHQGADLRFQELKTKIPSLYRFGENVAYNYGFPNPAVQAFNGWLQSPPHYASIMGDYNLAGRAIAL